MGSKGKNLLSRKFLLTLLGAISGIAAAVAGLGGKAGTIAGIVVSGATLLTYVITEGVIDAKAISMTTDLMKEIKDTKESDSSE